jgi:signal transduction histidine kinase
VLAAGLFDEVMHVVREALSNIKRHTNAANATIRLSRTGNDMLVEFVNDNEAPDVERNFVPRSIAERAADLGGRYSVEHRSGAHTAVIVQFPV